MKIVVIDIKDIPIRVEQHSIKVDKRSIPFRHIDILVLNHRQTMLTNDILKLTKNNISILIVSPYNNNFSLIAGAKPKNSEIKLAQFSYHKYGLSYAKYLIINKLKNHNEHLLSHNIDLEVSKQIDMAKDASSLETLLGIEGSYARKYFSSYFMLFPKILHKGVRSKKPPKDPVNAVMSYWYYLFYYFITVKLLSFGFEPSIGYLHRPFRDHFALSSDLLELFRSEINQAVYFLFAKEVLTESDFTHNKGGVYLKYEGRRKVWEQFISLSNILQKKLKDEISILRKIITHEANPDY